MRNFRKIVGLSLLAMLNSTLFAGSQQADEIVAFEKIMNELKNKKQEVQLSLPNSNLSNVAPVMAGKTYEFNVIGTYVIDNTWYAYLITDKNHLIKVKEKLVLGDKEIVSINNYGINVRSKSDNLPDNIYFLPVTGQKVEEMDIRFIADKVNGGTQR